MPGRLYLQEGREYYETSGSKQRREGGRERRRGSLAKDRGMQVKMARKADLSKMTFTVSTNSHWFQSLPGLLGLAALHR